MPTKRFVQRPEPIQTFYDQLGQMVRWLKRVGVKQVAMESDGVYWRTVYEALIEALKGRLSDRHRFLLKADSCPYRVA